MVIPESVQSVEIARAESPRGEVVLRRRANGTGADVLELRVNGVFVMDTLETTSEIELAAQALELVEEPSTVLVGGLGLGFTLQRVLADPRVERAVVVEIEETLVQWMRDGTVPHGPALLADTRATVVNADIAMAMRRGTPRPTTWCSSTSTTGPATWCTSATRRSTRRSSSAGAATSSVRVACSWCGRPTPRRTCSPRSARCSAPRRSRPTTCCCRTGRRSTSSYLARR